MARHLVIVTGASRGLGFAMAAQLLSRPGHLVVGLSRHPSSVLEAQPCGEGSRLEQWPVDLVQAPAAAQRLSAWLGERDPQEFDGACLINNAALLAPPAPLDEGDPRDASEALRVGLEAPVLLCAAFLRATREWRAREAQGCKVLNISSGLGRRALTGSSTYCAVKAGLDHFTRAVALDEAQRPHGAKLVSLAPGVIDTDMQAQLRSASPEGFPDQPVFQNLKAGGQLSSPEDAAKRVLAWLERPDFGANPVADVRD